MIVLSFSHALTAEQRAKLEALTDAPIERIAEVSANQDHGRDFVSRVVALADACALSSEQWQPEPLRIVRPFLNFVAVTLLAEFHGRMGYFPSCVRVRPVIGALPPRYEIAEILPLCKVREAARRRR